MSISRDGPMASFRILNDPSKGSQLVGGGSHQPVEFKLLMFEARRQ